jgi:hypothetical protein
MLSIFVNLAASLNIRCERITEGHRLGPEPGSFSSSSAADLAESDPPSE